MDDINYDKRVLGKMSIDSLLFNLETLADLEELQAEESGDTMTEYAHRYREAVIREAIIRLEFLKL